MEISRAAASSFGGLIRHARQRLGLSQKDVAGRIVKENGRAISAQYLNDLEHDRRNPPTVYILRQLATLLDLNEDRVFLAADRVPADIRRLALVDPTAVLNAFDRCRPRRQRGSER